MEKRRLNKEELNKILKKIRYEKSKIAI